MIQRSVSFQLFWRCFVRNIDCSDAIQIFAPFSRPVMLELACMRYFIFLKAVKNRRKDSLFFVDLSHLLFGKEMMLLPWLDTMSGSSRSLECRVGICNELLIFLSDAGEHFFRHVQLSSAWTYLKSSLSVRVATLTVYFHITHSSLLHEFSSRPVH